MANDNVIHGGEGIDSFDNGNDDAGIGIVTFNDDGSVTAWDEYGNDHDILHDIEVTTGQEYSLNRFNTPSVASSNFINIYGSQGWDDITDFVGTDTLILTDGITVSDISLSQSGNNLNINDFVGLFDRGGNRTGLQVNIDGAGNDNQYVGIVYGDLSGQTIDTLLANNHLTVE